MSGPKYLATMDEWMRDQEKRITSVERRRRRLQGGGGGGTTISVSDTGTIDMVLTGDSVTGYGISSHVTAVPVALLTGPGTIPPALLPAGGSRLTGEIIAFAGPTAPSGWLVCDGAAVSRATFAALFALIGTAYGVGDGSSTFNVPALAGKFPLGADASHPRGGSGGAETHTLTSAEIPAHNHTVLTRDPTGPVPGVLGLIRSDGGAMFANAGPSFRFSGPVEANTGGDGAHNNMPPWQGVNYLIKT